MDTMVIRSVLIGIGLMVSGCAPSLPVPVALSSQPPEVYVAFRPVPGSHLVYEHAQRMTYGAPGAPPTTESAKTVRTIDVLQPEPDGHVLRITHGGAAARVVIGRDGTFRSIGMADGSTDAVTAGRAADAMNQVFSLATMQSHLRPWAMHEQRPYVATIAPPGSSDRVEFRGTVRLRRVVRLGDREAAEFENVATVTLSGGPFTMTGEEWIDTATGTRLWSRMRMVGRFEQRGTAVDVTVEEEERLRPDRSRL